MSSNNMPEAMQSELLAKIKSVIEGYISILANTNPQWKPIFLQQYDKVKDIADAYALAEFLEKLTTELPKALEVTQRYKSHQLLIEGFAETLQETSGLTEVQAKTCVYWAVGTYGLPEAKRYPVLVFQGAFGTGKSNSMKTMEQFVYKPHWLGSNLSPAVLRDKLGEARDATAFIEEADGAEEKLILMRYEKETGQTTVKVPLKGGGYKTMPMDLFGATVLHKRIPFKDFALADRSIVIRTRKREGSFSVPNLGDEAHKGIQFLWDTARKYPEKYQLQGRAGDVWQPLINIAWNLGDVLWALLYAKEEVEKAMKVAKVGAVYETEELVLMALICEAALDLGKLDPKEKAIVRVSLKDIRDYLKREHDLNWTPQQVHQILAHLGFEVDKSGGVMKAIVPTELLRAKAAEFSF